LRTFIGTKLPATAERPRPW